MLRKRRGSIPASAAQCPPVPFIAQQGHLVQDPTNDEFSFKGVAPDDRLAGGPLQASELGSPESAHPEPPAPLPSTRAADAAVPAPVDPLQMAPAHMGAAQVGAAQMDSSAGAAAPVGSVPGAIPDVIEHVELSSVMSLMGGAPEALRPTPTSAPDSAIESNTSSSEAQQGPSGGAQARPTVTLEVTGEDPSLSKTVSPRHLVQGWLAEMVKAKASDLILRSGGRPSQRLDGKISFLKGRVPGPGPMLEVLQGILGEKRMEQFEETGAADAALDLDGLGRFRINAYKQMGEPAIVIRRINEKAPSLDELNLPVDALKDLALRKRGLVLVTGVAGSGKSTTLSAMIEFMNSNVERHVVTLEDPVELMFKERYCVISQREVGTDTVSFKQGIKHALRQSPDVIFIGEMRDAETVLAALEAIETGHLVMSTMHTVNAAQTVDRILGFFPAERHVQIRQRMADTLAGVLSMRLVPRKGGGQVPAFELMKVTPQVRELLEEGKTTELGRVIQAGVEPGLVSFNDRLFELVQSGFVDIDDAVQASDRPDELIMMVRGIQGGQRAAAKAVKQANPGAGQGASAPAQMRRRTDSDGSQPPSPGGASPAGPAKGPAAGPPNDGPRPQGGGSSLRLRGSGGY